jgi:hypothetical protein
MDSPMKKIMSRKRFVLSGIGLAFVGVFLWLGWWWKSKYSKSDCRETVMALIKRRIDYVKHSEEGLKRFADEYQEMMDGYVRDRLVKVSIFLPVFGMFDGWVMNSGYRDSYLGLQESLVTRYLLSVNFFDRATGEPSFDQVLNYQAGGIRVGLICGNPWANLAVES